MKKLIFGWVLLTVLLLAGVAVAPLIAITRRWMLNDGAGTGSYQKNEVIFGMIGESIRGLILLYLYPQMKGAGSALTTHSFCSRRDCFLAAGYTSFTGLMRSGMPIRAFDNSDHYQQ